MLDFNLDFVIVGLFFFLFLFTDLSCVVEVDHFGQFVRKAKTKTCKATTDPVWEQVS